MFAVGDIVGIYAPTVGYRKYHLCIKIDGGSNNDIHQFLYLNSDPNFSDVYAVDCSRVPCLPDSETGKTVFSFTMVPRYSAAKLKLYKAKKLGALDPALAAELLEFAKKVKALNRAEHETVCAALEMISKST